MPIEENPVQARSLEKTVVGAKRWEHEGMKVIAVVNQKGGCGKTTISVNVAACLAAAGERVLVVDLDPQGHAGGALGIDSDHLEKTLYNVLAEDEDTAALYQVLIPIDENLTLAPSNILLSAVEQQLSGKKGREDRLRECLVEAVPHYDFCIIDSPPSVGILTMNALRAAQVALIPVDMSRFSLHGMQKLLETINVICARTSHSISVRVVANMYEPRTNFSRKILSSLTENFKDGLCRTVIHRTIKVAEGAMDGMPIRSFAPYSSAHEDFADLAHELGSDPRLFDTPAPFPACVLFSYFDENAGDVKLAGSFNSWAASDRYRLMKNGGGIWKLYIPLKPGKYQYKFIVDGQWKEDPENPSQAIGEFGQKNSVIEVN
jgi:chromosome partitioning protein